MMLCSAISRGLCLALLATSAHGQTVSAGARAVVSSDTLPVYATMSSAGEAKATLKRGERVIIGLVLFGDDITWCAVTRPGETRRLGYSSCEFLEPDRGSAAAPAPAAPAAEPKKPITVREVPAPAPPPTLAAPAPAVSSPVPLPLQSESVPAPAPVTEPAPPAPARVPAAERVAPPPEPAAAPAPAASPGPPAPNPPAPITEPIAAPSPVRPPEPAAPAAPPEPIPAPVPVTTPAPPAATPTPVEAPPPASDVKPEDLADTALDNSGLRAAVEKYTRTTNLISFLDKGRLAYIDAPALESVLSEQFDPGVFHRAIGNQITKSEAPQLQPSLAEWLRSPVTQKLSDLERRALLPDSREALVGFAGELAKSRPAEARLELIHRLYDALKTCDMEVEATIALVHTVAQAIGPALPKEKRYSAAELDRALGAVKSRYRSIMKNARLVHYLFAYQTVSDAELDLYVTFLESESGKALVSLIGKGFYDATETISRSLMAEIPRKLKRR